MIFPGFRIWIRIDPDPHSFELLDPDSDPHSKMRMQIQIQEDKNDPQKWKNFMFWKAKCSFFRAEGFSCSLGVSNGSLGRGKLQFFIKKKNSAVKFFQFLVIKFLDPEQDTDPDLQLEEILDSDPHQINADPKPWSYHQSVMTHDSAELLQGFYPT
jgi:hypothetical protein